MRWKKNATISLMGMVLVTILMATSSFSAVPREEKEKLVVTQQQAKIDGKLLKYTAEVGRIAIRDVETGEPHGYMFYTAYRVPSSKPRPVTFVWNGGPGADSSLLHFSAVGPKLIQNGRLIDNPDSWLAESDLVLVDPIGTGFSRPVKTEYAAEFYSTIGDVASVTEFVRSWRILHGAEDTPLFLAGESWGADRAASVAYALKSRGVPVSGMILISGGWGLNKKYCPPILCSALHIVDMATTALYYHKTAPDLGKDLTAVRRSAEIWARKIYAPALARINNLSKDERTQLINQLSRFTGISPDQIDHKTLIITQRQFRTSLLKDQHKELYLFDMRRTTADGADNTPVILGYFRHNLGYHTDLPYIGLEDLKQGFAPSGIYPKPINARWNYATIPVTPEQMKAALEKASAEGGGPPSLGPPLPKTEEALKINPRMKVLVASGMYDSYLPCATGSETERQLPLTLQQSIRFKCYIGGHAMYEDPLARTELNKDVKALIASAGR